ncbi:mCG1035817 [Mus musculus]|nr:mCG1035817 [Mus musculus]
MQWTERVWTPPPQEELMDLQQKDRQGHTGGGATLSMDHCSVALQWTAGS